MNHVTWLAPSPRNDHYLAVSDSQIAVIDVEAKKVAATVTVNDGKLSLQKSYKLIDPHVYVLDLATGEPRCYYVDASGALASRQLGESRSLTPTNSYFDLEKGTLSVVQSNGKSHHVAQLRLSDDLVTLDRTLTAEGEATLGPDFLLVRSSSKLGMITNYQLESDTTKTLKGFNFNYLRNQ